MKIWICQIWPGWMGVELTQQTPNRSNSSSKGAASSHHPLAPHQHQLWGWDPSSSTNSNSNSSRVSSRRVVATAQVVLRDPSRCLPCHSGRRLQQQQQPGWEGHLTGGDP
jgi:hypothetical protein